MKSTKNITVQTNVQALVPTRLISAETLTPLVQILDTNSSAPGKVSFYKVIEIIPPKHIFLDCIFYISFVVVTNYLTGHSLSIGESNHANEDIEVCDGDSDCIDMILDEVAGTLGEKFLTYIDYLTL